MSNDLLSKVQSAQEIAGRFVVLLDEAGLSDSQEDAILQIRCGYDSLSSNLNDVMSEPSDARKFSRLSVASTSIGSALSAIVSGSAAFCLCGGLNLISDEQVKGLISNIYYDELNGKVRSLASSLRGY